jgi:hypothetical protein
VLGSYRHCFQNTYLRLCLRVLELGIVCPIMGGEDRSGHNRPSSQCSSWNYTNAFIISFLSSVFLSHLPTHSLLFSFQREMCELQREGKSECKAQLKLA